MLNITPWKKEKGKYRTAFDIEANDLFEHQEYDIKLQDYVEDIRDFITGNKNYIFQANILTSNSECYQKKSLELYSKLL